ncbi:MAG TPA: methylated-DNA--[protein]-cysteine S-methyltransferase [Solirubrobacteraceae bacterium]|nr:methylated-DNA--[protein]-cysteine S-methyltransferase [Solirubrobacteraceae bacterium]
MNEQIDRELTRIASALQTPDAGDAAQRFAERAAAADLIDVAYGELETPVGPVVVACTRQGLVRVAYADAPHWVLAQLAKRVSPRILRLPGGVDDVRRQLDEYFAGRRDDFELTLDWRLTDGFQRRVLRNTATIPRGQVSTYTEIARAAGSPRAARATGNALGANPLAIVVPCHRVVRTGGALGGYGGGLDAKRYLLSLEGALKD